jgi:hypothetical protein
MLGDVIFKETGKTIGMRVLSTDAGVVTVEVTLQTQGQIEEVDETSITMRGMGSAKGVGADGSINYRGGLHFLSAPSQPSPGPSPSGAKALQTPTHGS